MQYFDTIPKIIQTDTSGTSRILTNLMARVSIIPKLLKDPLVFYEYDIQDGDTPEIIAFKYYGDSYRYWVVLFANQITDPQWNWPLDNNTLYQYVVSKYPDNNVYSDIHHYQKTITQFDSATNTTSEEVVIIDQDTYNTLVESSDTYDIDGNLTSVTVTKQAVTLYDYELNVNESKRTIKILNAQYVDQLEDEFKKLMAK